MERDRESTMRHHRYFTANGLCRKTDRLKSSLTVESKADADTATSTKPEYTDTDDNDMDVDTQP